MVHRPPQKGVPTDPAADRAGQAYAMMTGKGGEADEAQANPDAENEKVEVADFVELEKALAVAEQGLSQMRSVLEQLVKMHAGAAAGGAESPEAEGPERLEQQPSVQGAA